jgi:hypothetical protein
MSAGFVVVVAFPLRRARHRWGRGGRLVLGTNGNCDQASGSPALAYQPTYPLEGGAVFPISRHFCRVGYFMAVVFLWSGLLHFSPFVRATFAPSGGCWAAVVIKWFIWGGTPIPFGMWLRFLFFSFVLLFLCVGQISHGDGGEELKPRPCLCVESIIPRVVFFSLSPCL